jgi:DNA-directed RNA polymerase subunit RPC12/RpoP
MTEPTVLLGGLTWEELAADRRVRRLRRGKHFRGDVRAVQHEAAAAAEAMGLAVRAVRDDFLRTAYVWIQFTDAELPLGEPCPRCGSKELVRTHEHYGRCPQCGARLAFLLGVTPAEGGVGTRAQSAKQRRQEARLLRQRIDMFTNVRLVFDPEESDEEQEVWYGRGEYEDEALLLRVVYPLREGARQPHPHSPEDELHYVRYWGLEPYARAIELGVDLD